MNEDNFRHQITLIKYRHLQSIFLSLSLCLSLTLSFSFRQLYRKKFDCSTLLSLFSVVHKNSCEQVVPFHLRVSSFFHRHHQNRQKVCGRKITALIKNRRTPIHSNIKPMKIYVTLGNEWLKIMKKKNRIKKL